MEDWDTYKEERRSITLAKDLLEKLSETFQNNLRGSLICSVFWAAGTYLGYKINQTDPLGVCFFATWFLGIGLSIGWIAGISAMFFMAKHYTKS